MVRLVFWCSTGSWIMGQAIAKTNPHAAYSETECDHQVVEGDVITVVLESFNEAIRSTPLIGGSPEEYVLTLEDFRKFKDWLRKKGKVIEETDTKIILRGEAEG